MSYPTTDELIGLGISPEKAQEQSSGPAAREGRKYIIQFGSDKNTSYCRINAEMMEVKAPFDGTVVDITIPDPLLGRINSVNSVARGYKIPWELFDTPVQDLKAAKFKRYTENFIRMNIGSRQGTGYPVMNPMKYTDRATYLHNIRMFTRVAKQVNFRGVLMDTERYNSATLWGKYSDMDQTYTYEEYKAAFKSLGEEAMATIMEEFPNCVIVIAVSYEQVELHDTGSLETNNYGLLPSFLDGFHDAAIDPIKIVNFGEEAFSNTTAGDMDYDIRYQNRALLTVCKSKNYDRVHEHGLATAIDYPFSGFDFATDTNNYNSAEQFRTNIGLILERVPRYCFVYSQEPKWYSGTAGVDATPLAYVDALASARADAGIEVVYNPKSIPGCKLYSTAFDLSGANDSAISSWTNQVTGTADFTQSGGNRPVLQTSSLFGTNIPSVKFTSASSQYLTGNSLASNWSGTDAGYWFICVHIGTSDALAADETFFGVGLAGNANTDISFGVSSNERWFGRRTDDAGSTVQLNSIHQASIEAPLYSTAHVFAYRNIGTIGQAFLDNTEVIVRAEQDVGLTTCDQLFIGAAAKNTAIKHNNGQIGAILAGTGIIDDDNLKVACRWLAQRFLITTVL